MKLKEVVRNDSQDLIEEKREELKQKIAKNRIKHIQNF